MLYRSLHMAINDMAGRGKDELFFVNFSTFFSKITQNPHKVFDVVHASLRW